MGSTKTDTANNLQRTNGNEQSNIAESEIPSRAEENGSQNINNQLLNSDGANGNSNQPNTGSLGSSSNIRKSSSNKPEQTGNNNFERGPGSINPGESAFPIGNRKNLENTGGYVAPGGSVSNGQSQGSLSGGKPNDNFQLIQNGQASENGNGQQGFSGSASIQPLDIGYGSPGGQILGSYN